MDKCKRCGKAGKLFSISDAFGDLGFRKINLCLCEVCEGLLRAKDQDFMRAGSRITSGKHPHPRVSRAGRCPQS